MAEAEEKEEAGGKKIDRRGRDETDFGCKGCSQNAAFQVRIFTFFFFPLLSSPCPVRVRHGHGRQIFRVHAFLIVNSLSKEHTNKFRLEFFVQRIDHINVWVKPACVIRFSCLVNTTC